MAVIALHPVGRGRRSAPSGVFPEDKGVMLQRNRDNLARVLVYNRSEGEGSEPRVHLELDELMAAVQRRDERALELLYDRTVSQVYGLAMHLLRHAADAEEVACGVYERLWMRASHYDASRGSVMAWLLVMCRSRALDALKGRRARARRDERAAPDEETEVDDPESLLDRLQAGSAVHRALERLSPQRRQLVALAYFRDLSHGELAERLGLPLGTVKSHLRRSLAELRRALELERALEGDTHE
ncbi:MAG: sigma-70 family RNA polymerase sigma factor [Steroidobacteraceae bacterium]